MSCEDELTDQSNKNVEIKHAWCQMCGPARSFCSTLCTVVDGKWVAVQGNPKAGNNSQPESVSLCAKGNAAMDTLYAPDRIIYPMKRTGKKGAGEFERISWDQAIDEIAQKLLEQKELYGAKSLGILSPQYFKVLGTIGRRFLNVHGSPNYLHSGICAIQRQYSKLVTIGGSPLKKANTTNPGKLKKTKLLVNWGYNTENSAANRGNPRARIDAQDAGMQTVDIRPMMDAMAAKADMWVPVRPGTDCALAMALLSTIIQEDLYDHDFVENWCYGFDELAEYMKPYDAAWGNEQTGIPEAQIRELAHMMATIKPMAIYLGNGIGDQQTDGHWAVACASLIEAITGNLGIDGGGAMPSPPPPLIKINEISLLSERLPKSAEDERRGYMAGVSDLVAPETPRWFQTMDTQESGPTSAYFKAIESILTEDPYPLRCLIAQATNPLSATRQPKRVAEALEKLDLFVVMDTQWNPSCDYADYVLPAAVHYETGDQIAVKNGANGTFIGINQPVADPPGECRSDWQFYLDLACKMGYGSDFWDGDMDACLREQLEGSGVTLEELRASSDGILVPRESAPPKQASGEVPYEKMFANLPHGKVQCKNEYIGGKPDATETGVLSEFPVYRGPAESPASTPHLLEEYPYILSDVHAYGLCQHGYYSNIASLREFAPKPWVKINPKTAAAHGIAQGDWVRIESPHGWVKLVADLTETVSPEVLMAKRGWWQPCEELGEPGYSCFDGGSDVNVLYESAAESFDVFHSGMGKQTLVNISKIEQPDDPKKGEEAK